MNVSIGFDAMSILILITVIGFFFSYKQLRQRDGKSFLALCVWSLITLVLDMFTWILDGNKGEVIHNADLIVTQFYFIFTVGEAFLCIFYIISKCRIKKKINRILFYSSIALFFVYLCFIFVSFPLNLVFKIDENNYYGRGPLYWVTYLFYFGFLIINLIGTIVNRDDIKGREFLSFIFLTILPVVSLSAQFIIYNIFANTLSYGIFAIGLYLVFINNQEFAIQDAGFDKMTNIRNRTTYLNMVDNQFKEYRSCAIIFFDINNLKYVNDNFGHAVGDHIIINVANSLKTLEKENVMSFRIGGDEFVTVYGNGKKEDIEEYIRAWKAEISDIMKNDVYKAEVAYGYSFSEGAFNIDFLSREADINMYAQKKTLKAAREKANELSGVKTIKEEAK